MLRLLLRPGLKPGRHHYSLSHSSFSTSSFSSSPPPSTSPSSGASSPLPDLFPLTDTPPCPQPSTRNDPLPPFPPPAPNDPFPPHAGLSRAPASASLAPLLPRPPPAHSPSPGATPAPATTPTISTAAAAHEATTGAAALLAAAASAPESRASSCVGHVRFRESVILFSSPDTDPPGTPQTLSPLATSPARIPPSPLLPRFSPAPASPSLPPARYYPRLAAPTLGPPGSLLLSGGGLTGPLAWQDQGVCHWCRLWTLSSADCSAVKSSSFRHHAGLLHLQPWQQLSSSAGPSGRRGGGRGAEEGGREKGLAAQEEDVFDSITDKIPERPVTAVEGASYSFVILLFLGLAFGALFYVFKELVWEPREYRVFNQALARVQRDAQVVSLLGSSITGYGQETRNRAARQRISHKSWTDEDGVEKIMVQFHIRGTGGAGLVHCEMFKDKKDKGKYKYTYLVVEIQQPVHRKLMLESYIPT